MIRGWCEDMIFGYNHRNCLLMSSVISVQCINVTHGQRPTQRGIKGFRAILPKLDLTTDAEYVANLVQCQYVFVDVQQCSLLHGYAIPA